MSTQLEQLQHDVLHALEDLKALDLVILDVAQYTAMMERLVICNGRSNRHVQSLAENLVQSLKDKGVQALSVTGLEAGEWVLVDFGSVVIHIMLPEKRDLYQLEKLWSMPSSDAHHRADT